jgi:hypothetical protein
MHARPRKNRRRRRGRPNRIRTGWSKRRASKRKGRSRPREKRRRKRKRRRRRSRPDQCATSNPLPIRKDRKKGTWSNASAATNADTLPRIAYSNENSPNACTVWETTIITTVELGPVSNATN